MENIQNKDLKLLIDVLSQGNDHIMELEACLGNHHTLSSETCHQLSSKLQSTFATAITMTKLIAQKSLRPPPLATDLGPRSEVFKKRKTLPRWSDQVQVSSAIEIPIDDGYSWRKYGQKDILGAKFPRCYYRCTHRHSHGCFATKQVQRSDNNTSFFNITYRGVHTCNNSLQKPLLLSTNNQSNVVLKDHKPESCSSFSTSNPDNYVALDSEIADIIFASTSTTSSQMLGMDCGMDQLVFDADFSFDFY